MTQIHLCQPDDVKSCGACCGIYNYVVNTREELSARFDYRRKLMQKVRHGELSLESYRDALRHREDGRRIYKTIYTCEFAGWLDGDRKRVGCMIHPMQNAGIDMRDMSFYGREICEGHFCPSYQKLSDNEARIIVDTLDDWYLFGAVITDIDYVKTLFRIIQDMIGEEIKPERIRNSDKLKNILNRYYKFKVSWPFRDVKRPRFGKYYFVGEEYDIDKIDYACLGADIPVYDPVFLSLSSAFESRGELDVAINAIDVLIEEFTYEYSGIDRQDYRFRP
jgi:hypothetical protein